MLVRIFILVCSGNVQDYGLGRAVALPRPGPSKGDPLKLNSGVFETH
jgi:hypothetical protein